MNDQEAQSETSNTSVVTTQEAVKAESNTPTPRKPSPIAQVVERYLGALRGIGQTAQIALPHIAQWTLDELETTQKDIERFIPSLPKKGAESAPLSFDSARDFAKFSDTIRKLEELSQLKATAILSKSLFTQLFAEFDTFIGELLKTIYLKNETLLKGITREISLSELLEHGDLNSVKRSMLDKEIETFRRDSYVEQFATLEKKFSLPLRKFSEWPAFVELSQRRNVLTHNGGLVSDQYLTVCEREGYEFSARPEVGQSVGVPFDYFLIALRLLSKVGLMLAYTLWSKVFPKETQELHIELNGTVFNCLQQKRWNLVAELSDFVLSEGMKKSIPEVDLRIRVVNAAIGIKFAGNDSAALRLLQSVDWSASHRDFKLAIAVLEERFSDAVNLMKSIGKSGELVNQNNYHTWPLFTKFRERPEFYSAYLEVYGEAFAEKLEAPEGPVQTHAGASVANEVVDINAREIPTPNAEAKSPAKQRSPVKKTKIAPTDGAA